MIDLRSDTVTRPTPAMLDAMFNAEVGDDVFGDDPTVNALEEKTAGMFGKESALFCPSGTMTNQIAIKVHTQPGDEVICAGEAHIYNHEGGGIAFNSGCSIRCIISDRGRFKAMNIPDHINPDNVHYAVSRLVCLENTCNKGGGAYYHFADIREISKTCREKKLKLHLDGARLFNALVETGNTPEEFGSLFDSISICLSKGLGCPVGSILIGDSGFIQKARRIRKVFGGSLRQAGYLAAAGIYALDHHIPRLREDHIRAKELGKTIQALPFVREIMPVDTNIIIFKIDDSVNSDHFISKLKDRNILSVGFGPQTVRMVTHLDFDDNMMEKVIQTLKNIS